MLIAVLSLTVSEWAISRACGLIVGMALFGQPLISHVVNELERTVPDWKSKLILEMWVGTFHHHQAQLTCSNLFDTVPTNAQLVLDLLRQGERCKRPITPAPSPDTPLSHGNKVAALEQGHDDDGDIEDQDREARDRRLDIISDLSHVTEKGKETSRAKVRKAWEKIGRTKEDVSRRKRG